MECQRAMPIIAHTKPLNAIAASSDLPWARSL
jgi:hypothetical protein